LRPFRSSSRSTTPSAFSRGELVRQLPGDLIGVVADLPDDHGGDLDRVAVGVVDLGLRRLLVADPGRDLDPVGERVHPLQAGLADREAYRPNSWTTRAWPGTTAVRSASSREPAMKTRTHSNITAFADAAMVVTCVVAAAPRTRDVS
jgi:hypothetical protein